MNSPNAGLFLFCCNRAQLLKRLLQKRTLGFKSQNFVTCTIDRCKMNNSTFQFTPVSVKPNTEEQKIGEELTRKLNKTEILKVINIFCRLPVVSHLAQENGLNEALCQKGVLSFRKFCIDSTTLPADLHIVLSDIIGGHGKPIDIFPYFLRHIRNMFPHLDCMDDLKKFGDISQPANWYPEARAMKRKFYFHHGPTNSGKTFNALQDFYKSKSGIYCAPLKLLAVEVFNKANAQGSSCDLLTGEDVVFVKENREPASHLSCTIEMAPFDKEFDVAVIDEIQMVKDLQRGWAWTRALLGLRAKEIHICGEEAAKDIVDSILCTTNEQFEDRKYERLTKLTVSSPLGSFKNVCPGDCIVCFNKGDIYMVASSLEALGHQVSIVYGSLPPKTKLRQCEKFNDPGDPHKILVATDAIGMGLNLSIKRIIFYSLMKHSTDGASDVKKTPISVSQALQIAGRAGRFGTEHSEGLVTTFKSKDLALLENLLSKKPETIKCAGIFPTVDQVELFSYYLPQSSLSEIIEILVTLSTVDNSLYFMCEYKELKALAQMIDHISLPLRTKYVFSCAPVNRKLHFVCVMFIKYAKMFSMNQAITVKWICPKINWPLSAPETLRDLIMLETYYEVLDLYLWLSNRFAAYFPDADIVRQMQREIDDFIQTGVVKLTKLTEAEKDCGADNESDESKIKESSPE